MKKTYLGMPFQSWLLAFLSVMLVFVSAHCPWLYGLSFVWALPLAMALQKATIKQAVTLSLVCAFSFWLLSVNWLVLVLIKGAESPLFFAVISYALICLWQAVPYAILGGCYAYFKWGEHKLGPFFAAALLTVVWAWFPTLIPGLPQHALYRSPEFIAVLDVSGTSGLLFLSMLTCFSIQQAVVSREHYRWGYLLLAVLIPLFMLGYGKYRNMQYQVEVANSRVDQWLTVAYVQPSLVRPASADKLYELSEQAIRNHSPDLLIWPELSIVYSLINRGDDRRNTFALAKKYQQDMLVASGYVYATDDKVGEMRTYYNRAHLIQNNKTKGEYSKQLLVPLYEYMPKSLSFLRRWAKGVNYFRAGSSDQALINYREGLNLAVVICYEAIFPSFVRTQVEKGASMIINPVSDTVFDGTAGGEYHLSLAYFRSLENRLPFVRVANTGTSVIVAANGELLAQPGRQGEALYSAAEVFIPDRPGLYSRIGDWFSVFLLSILLALGGLYLWRKKTF